MTPNAEIIEIDNESLHQVLRGIAAGKVEIIETNSDEEFDRLVTASEKKKL